MEEIGNCKKLINQEFLYFFVYLFSLLFFLSRLNFFFFVSVLALLVSKVKEYQVETIVDTLH